MSALRNAKTENRIQRYNEKNRDLKISVFFGIAWSIACRGAKARILFSKQKIFSDKCKKAYKEAAKKNRIFYLKSTKNVHKACDKTRKMI
ncbi:MAG: hypothetical protein BHW43_06120 [Phascolarctobacterium succinatutens]|uniref:Uncharacterized protein n=1 Tax=Phascolarctobacterium succinatutens TaxID=626940 RepID=A0A1Q6R4U7_9FIRM|nr:MAG: hypothetical protein BHW43_06120 [Phascolarctobacterium succinatutens]